MHRPLLLSSGQSALYRHHPFTIASNIHLLPCPHRPDCTSAYMLNVGILEAYLRQPAFFFSLPSQVHYFNDVLKSGNESGSDRTSETYPTPSRMGSQSDFLERRRRHYHGEVEGVLPLRLGGRQVIPVPAAIPAVLYAGRLLSAMDSFPRASVDASLRRKTGTFEFFQPCARRSC